MPQSTPRPTATDRRCWFAAMLLVAAVCLAIAAALNELQLSPPDDISGRTVGCQRPAMVLPPYARRAGARGGWAWWELREVAHWPLAKRAEADAGPRREFC